MSGQPWHVPEAEAQDLPPGALEGVRVLEFGTILAIPSCGVHLSDMGADVIKVEPPNGDPHRGPQPIIPSEGKGFIAMNRGKHGICVDMTRPEARPVIARLVESADVVLMSLKPSDLPRFGLTYEELREVNPRIIYLEHQPFGEAGPYGGEGGYDVVVQGMSGVAAMMARASGPAPATVTPAIADMTTGVASALAVVAALLHRERTGEGQRVRSSLLASSILLAGNRTNWFGATDPVPYERFATEIAAARERGADFEEQRDIYLETIFPAAKLGANTYFRYYRTSDGLISLGSTSPAINARIRRVLELDDPRTEPDFDLSDPDDQQRLRTFAEACEAKLTERTSEEWITAFRAEDIPSGPVNWPPESFDDPQIAENRFYAELDHELIGPHKTFGPVVQMDASPLRTHGSSPPLDRDTDRILEAAGFSEDELDTLRAAGVIGRAG
jgi:formyl-CoA transferase